MSSCLFVQYTMPGQHSQPTFCLFFSFLLSCYYYASYVFFHATGRWFISNIIKKRTRIAILARFVHMKIRVTEESVQVDSEGIKKKKKRSFRLSPLGVEPTVAVLAGTPFSAARESHCYSVRLVPKLAFECHSLCLLLLCHILTPPSG